MLQSFVVFLKHTLEKGLVCFQQPTPLSGFQKDHHRKPTPSASKKPFKKYDGPVYVPAEVYKVLSPEVVASLKKYNTEAINEFAKKRGIHVTDIDDHVGI